VVRVENCVSDVFVLQEALAFVVDFRSINLRYFGRRRECVGFAVDVIHV